MVKLAILAIHGVGTRNNENFTKFRDNLTIQLAKKGIGNDDFAYLGFRYAPVFEDRADTVFSLVQDLDWRRTRHFVIHYLGDALAYQSGTPDPNRIDYYGQIHDLLQQKIHQWRSEIGKDVPLVIIAHSLGAYIISNYIWDHQKQKILKTDFENMETVCMMVTMGCNIPILTLGFSYDKLYPINLPGEAVDDGAHVKWLNYFDKDDPLGMPLQKFYHFKTHEQERTKNKIVDVQINIGSFFSGRTPLVHGQYWKDKSMTKEISEQIYTLYQEV